jgi:hypothetical protein
MSTKIAQHAYEELRNRVEREEEARGRKGRGDEEGVHERLRDPGGRTGKSSYPCEDDSADEQRGRGATSSDTASDFEESFEVAACARVSCRWRLIMIIQSEIFGGKCRCFKGKPRRI